MLGLCRVNHLWRPGVVCAFALYCVFICYLRANKLTEELYFINIAFHGQRYRLSPSVKVREVIVHSPLGNMIEMCLTSFICGACPSRARAELRADDSQVKTEPHWRWYTAQPAKVITLSLVHCCLLSDLIWSRRHTWAKPHPSQVLQGPPSSILPFLSVSLSPSLAFLHISRFSSIFTNLSEICARCLSSSSSARSFSHHSSLFHWLSQKTLYSEN